MMKLAKQHTKRLCVLWAVTFLGFRGIINLLLGELGPVGGTALAESYDVYQYITMLAVLVYFCPLLFLIQKKAKIAEMKAIMVAARLILAQHIIWLILGVVEVFSGGFPS